MGLLTALGLKKKVVVTALSDAAEPAAQAEGDGAAPAKPPSDYEVKRDAARKLLDALKKHKQKAHVAAEIGAATTHLTQAAAEAAKKDMPKALAEVEEARKACVAGKGFADQFAAYMLKRAEAVDAINSAAAVGFANTMAGVLAADAKAASPGRDYAGATAALQAVIDPLAAKFKKRYLDDVAPAIATLKAHKAVAFVKREVDQIDAAQKQVADALAAKLWRKMQLAAIKVGAIFTPMGGLIDKATRMADRRVVFDDQRVLTMAAIQGVKAKPTLSAPLIPIAQALLQADALASPAQMQIDDGVKALQSIVERCAVLQKLEPVASVYAAERHSAADGVEALAKHVAAKKIATELAALRKQLDAAAALAGNPPNGPHGMIGPDPMRQNFPAARAAVRLIVADTAAAKQVADGLTGVIAAEAVGGGKAPDAAQIKQAVADIRKDAAAAAKAPHADLAAKRLANCEGALKEAEKKAANKQPEVAAQVLIGASLELVAARKIQVEKARFDAAYKLLDDRRKALAALPEGKAIAPRIDGLAKVLAAASKFDKAADWPQAMAQLRLAEAAAGSADAAAIARKACDSRIAAVKPHIAEAKYAAIKGDQEKSLKQAQALSNKLDFDGANRALTDIDNRMDGAEVATLATTAPGDAKLVDAAKRMMAKGGQKALDDVIKNLPDTVDKAVLEKLAKERFDLEVVADAGPGAQKALKQMCLLMASVPADVVTKNPSLKKVERIEAGGAFYESNTNRVVMNARPKKSDKADFPDATGRLPKREKDCEPQNKKKEDLFDFNMLHELAHSIDDANNFMPRREGDAAFGGWIMHGGNVEPIAAAVAAKTGFDKRPEDLKYVLDKILLGSSAAPPDPPEGDAKAVADWQKLMQDVDDWHTAATTEGVWSDQGASESITMKDKRIYHEAYKGKWVSYLASARSRGITGYQFRAPGEWFSELYAAYKIGKLKPSHPSVGWLSKLSI